MLLEVSTYHVQRGRELGVTQNSPIFPIDGKSPSSETSHWEHEWNKLKRKSRVVYTKKLSPSVFLQVSSKCDMMSGQWPTMLATTLISDGLCSSVVMMGWQRLDRDIIQLRCSAPSKRDTENLFMEKGLKLPNTDDYTSLRHLYSRCKSKIGKSESLSLYQLPRYSTYVSVILSGPPEMATCSCLQQQPRTQ